MRDLLPDIDRWLAAGKPVGLATVVETWGSSPRPAGARMAFTLDQEISGSVSGGCVEGAVVEAGLETLRTGRPQLLHFGVANEKAWEAGLACGGSLDVFVSRLDPEVYAAARAALAKSWAYVLAMAVGGPADLVGREVLLLDDGQTARARGTASAPLQEQAAWEAAILPEAQAALRAGQSRRAALELGGQPVEVFFEVSLPPSVLIAVGGVHISIVLTRLASELGFRTIVVDPRGAFGSQARFPHVDQLVNAWPDDALRQIGLTRGTALAMLTHDPKLDDPALLLALPSEAFYVGALGSRQTQAARRERLLAAGLSQAHLARLRGPIGLDLGGRTPAEIALAILAEIVAARNGRAPGPGRGNLRGPE